MPRPFTKPATTIAQQLQHLQAEGMAIPDVVRAEHWLRHVSYYRLSAYWLPFEYPKGTSGARFLPGTSFDTGRRVWCLNWKRGVEMPQQ